MTDITWQVIHGDCLEILPTLAAGSVDVVVTSPPYDALRDYGKGFSPGALDWRGVIMELYRVIAPDGGVAVWIVADQTIDGNETGTSFRQALWAQECGFKLHDTMIWFKGTFTSPQTNRYPNSFEYMFVWTKGKPTCNQLRDRPNRKVGTSSTRSIRKANGTTKPMYADNRATFIEEYGTRFNVWHIWPEQSNTNRVHPAQFPIPLARDHVLSWSKPGDLVLDPFAGSGTTGVACLQTGRNFIGIELDAGYCDIARARIEKAAEQARQMELFEGAG